MSTVAAELAEARQALREAKRQALREQLEMADGISRSMEEVSAARLKLAADLGDPQCVLEGKDVVDKPDTSQKETQLWNGFVTMVLNLLDKKPDDVTGGTLSYFVREHAELLSPSSSHERLMSRSFLAGDTNAGVEKNKEDSRGR